MTMIDGQMTVEDVLNKYGVPLVHTPRGINVAVAARDEAIDRVERNADSHWKVAATNCVMTLARTNAEFTTDDVWSLLVGWPESTHEPRAMGPVMRKVANAGIIEATDQYRQSERKECHARPVKVWRSLIYTGDE